MPDPVVHSGGEGTVSIGGAVLCSTGWEFTETAEWIDITTTCDYDADDEITYTRKKAVAREGAFSFEGFVDEGSLGGAAIRAGTVTGAWILKLYDGGQISGDHARVMTAKLASGGPKGANTWALTLESQGKVTWLS